LGLRWCFWPVTTIRPSVKVRCSVIEYGSASQPARDQLRQDVLAARVRFVAHPGTPPLTGINTGISVVL
jgi:hypothetical protein